MKLTVNSNSKSPVEVFMQLSVQRKAGAEQFGIGFELYQMKGRKVVDKHNPPPVETNNGGYKISDSVFFDGHLDSTSSGPLTLLLTTFEPEIEARFRFTLHYKDAEGRVKLERLQ